MARKFTCEIEYVKSPHLNQIYVGFDMLKKQGIINLKYKKRQKNSSNPFVKVLINKKYRVIYDTLDGLNWIQGSCDDNLLYFSKIEADYYFKRSYTEKLKSANKQIKVYPLGFNHFIEHKHLFNDSLKNVIKNSSIYNYIRPKKKTLNIPYFEQLNNGGNSNQIIFFTRLWDPTNETNRQKKDFLNSINNFRISVVKTCKEEFGNLFIGGIEDSQYARSLASEHICKPEVTQKFNYLNNLKNSSICIATTGLHDSNGWKLAEYIVSGKAIISQPLKHKVTGDFSKGRNYLEFNNKSQLVQTINTLLNNDDLVDNMMRNNTRYYNTYLRPDKLILNSLNTIMEDME